MCHYWTISKQTGTTYLDKILTLTSKARLISIILEQFTIFSFVIHVRFGIIKALEG